MFATILQLAGLAVIGAGAVVALGVAGVLLAAGGVVLVAGLALERNS